MDFYIPKEIIVGFQNRGDSLNERLAFITYKKEDGTLFNGGNFNKWIDKDIPLETYPNEPQGEFVVNKGIQHGNSFFSGEPKIRVYDSRNIEFEILTGNFLYVVKHSEMSKGNIQQDCVYGWLNNQVYLLPTNSQEYEDSMLFTKHINKKVEEYELGSVYQDKKQNQYIYLGNFKLPYIKEDYDRYYYHHERKREIKSKKGDFFLNETNGLFMSTAEKLNSHVTPWMEKSDCQTLANTMKKLSDSKVRKEFLYVHAIDCIDLFVDMIMWVKETNGISYIEKNSYQKESRLMIKQSRLIKEDGENRVEYKNINICEQNGEMAICWGENWIKVSNNRDEVKSEILKLCEYTCEVEFIQINDQFFPTKIFEDIVDYSNYTKDVDYLYKMLDHFVFND